MLGYRNLDKIREKLQPILLRRTRQEVLGQLPERTDSVVYVEMREEQRVLYAEQQTSLARLLQKKYLTEVDRRRILCCLANMRMLCDSTFRQVDLSNVRISDCQLEGMEINGISVTDLFAAYRKQVQEGAGGSS